MFSYYGPLSMEFYNATKPIGHSFGDIEYYSKRLQGITGKILEPAVGSGRLFIPLLEQGFAVDGLDYSATMLKACKKACKQKGFKPELHEATLQGFSLPTRYKAIIIPAGSFCLIETRADALEALGNFYTHLSPQGRLILDVELPYYWNTGDCKTFTVELENGDGITLESKSIAIDWINQRTLSYLKYEKWRSGKLMDTELQKFVLSWYGIEEFKLLLAATGFTHISCSADYVYEQNPTQNTKILTFEAIRT